MSQHSSLQNNRSPFMGMKYVNSWASRLWTHFFTKGTRVCIFPWQIYVATFHDHEPCFVCLILSPSTTFCCPTHRRAHLNYRFLGWPSKYYRRVDSVVISANVHDKPLRAFLWFLTFLPQAPQGHIRRVRSLEWTISSSPWKILWNWRKVALSLKVALMKVGMTSLAFLFLVTSKVSQGHKMDWDPRWSVCCCLML